MAHDESSTSQAGLLFAQSAAIMAQLRAPGGCPWDLEQTPSTIRKYTLEETYEVLDAIERKDWPNLAEELGDLLLQVLFYALMAEEAGHFDLEDVITGLNRKLVRRHPHVFGEEAASLAGNRVQELAQVEEGSPQASAAVLLNWNSIKQMENQAKALPSGCLAGVLRAQSALSEAGKLGSSAARVGFDWPNASGLFEKVREETAEVEAELANSATPFSQLVRARIHEEVGDLLFTVANLARHLKVDSEMALRDANAKFRRRFESMEQAAIERRRPLDEHTAVELEQAWAAVKAAETV